jgi:phosphatidylglycerol:prolipoprotein diacylglycerol transferase
MTFPVTFHVFGAAIPAHPVFELLGYTAGFQCYRIMRRREKPSEKLPLEVTVWLLAAAVMGAAVGSKVLAWIESWPDYWAVRDDPSAWLGAKTIIGGLLGAWIGVEIAKRIMGVRRNTGDAFVLSLLIGIFIGRWGCFLTGLPDHTYGTPTNLPWGVDFGDGIHRHPTQLYESFLMIPLGVALLWRARQPHAKGELFRWFLLGYLTWRFFVEFIKPRYHPYLGLSALQIASLVGAMACAISLIRMNRGDGGRQADGDLPTAGGQRPPVPAAVGPRL